MTAKHSGKRSALALVLGQARAIVEERFAHHGNCPEGRVAFADHPRACLHCALVIAGGGDWRATSLAVTAVREAMRKPEWPLWLQPDLGGARVNADAWHRLTGVRLDTRSGAVSALNAAIASMEAP